MIHSVVLCPTYVCSLSRGGRENTRNYTHKSLIGSTHGRGFESRQVHVRTVDVYTFTESFMWKYIIRQLQGNYNHQSDDSEEQKLFEKTQIVIYQSGTLKQLQLALTLIRKYETLMEVHQYPLYMVERHHELTKMWGIRFKLWKRG